MSDAANLIFSLAGSLCAATSLAAGEALRSNDEPFRRRITARMLLALVFLAAALVGNTVELLRTQSGLSSGVGLCWLLLAGGTATALWTFAFGPRRRGEETLAERITPRGKLALGLLAVAQLLELASGRTTTMLQQLFNPSGAISLLAMLGLLLLALGTTAAVALFRSRSPVLPGTGSVVQRLSPLAKGTFILLTLALGLIALASFLSPELGRLLSLVLLTLGITTGLMALFFTSKFDLRNEPGRWGISPRGWVSLTLLGLAGVVLGAQEGRLLGIADRRWGRELDSARTAVPQPVGQVVDAPSLWSLRSNYTPGTVDPALRTTHPSPQPLPSPQPSSEQVRLSQLEERLNKRLDDLTAAFKASQGQHPSAQQPGGGRANSVETPASSYPVTDLSKGFPR